MREVISLYAPETPSVGEDFYYSMREEDERKGSHIYGGHAEATAILIPFAR